MADQKQIITGLQEAAAYFRSSFDALYGTAACEKFRGWTDAIEQSIALLKAQEPRVMTAEEVADCEEGTVLWVEERQGVTWNLFPLEIDVSSTHPDTGTNYLFFITYHGIRKFECDEYNRTWRCWTSRPTDAQREAIPWE